MSGTSTPADRVALPVLQRPKTVGDCRQGPRPCALVSCRFNLLVDVDERGRISLHTPNGTVRLDDRTSDDAFSAAVDAALETWSASGSSLSSCALDEIEANGEHTLEQVAALLGITRERARQIEQAALAKLPSKGKKQGVQWVS